LQLTTQEKLVKITGQVLPFGAYQRRVRRRVRGWVPPHRFVDVDVVDKQSNEVTEEELKFKQHTPLHRQLWDLTVPEGDDCLSCQRRAGKACTWTAPAKVKQKPAVTSLGQTQRCPPAHRLKKVWYCLRNLSWLSWSMPATKQKRQHPEDVWDDCCRQTWAGICPAKAMFGTRPADSTRPF